MRIIFISILLIVFSNINSSVFGQTLPGAFSVTGAGYSTAVVTDYQCVGINPANLGWKRNNQLVNFGVGETNMSIYSEPLKRTLINELFDKDNNFTKEEKDEAVKNFTRAKLQMEGSINGVGLSFQDDKIGGFGVAIKERFMWDSYLNEQSADLLFNGYNSDYFDTLLINLQTGDTTGFRENALLLSEVFEDTYLKMTWFREFNFSYGRRIINRDNFSLYIGIGIKYIQGYSVFNYSYEDGVINTYSALNPAFKVDYDAYSPSQIDNDEYQTVGNGWGLDFGVSALLFNKLRLALALTDYGKIVWDGNVYTGEDATVNNIQSAGMNNYNIFDLEENLIVGSVDWGGWEGLENKTTELPMNLRFGSSYLLNEKYEFGLEMYIPTNTVPGSYDKMIVGFGTRLQPVKWFRASIGLVTGGETGTDIPVGISFFPFNNDSFSWELGVAIRDVTTYFSQNKPTVSIALGLMRFSFGSSNN